MRVTGGPWTMALIATLLVSACTDPTGRAAGDGRRLRPYQDHVHVTAWPRGAPDVERIWAHAEHVLTPHDPTVAPHELVVRPATVARLRAHGVPLRVDGIDVQAMIDESYRTAASPQAGPILQLDDRSSLFGPFFARVQPLAAIEAYLGELVQASQGRAQLVNLGKSVENRDIKAIRISASPEGSDRPSAIITGTQHAREWASPMVTIGLADALIRQYGTNPLVKQAVDALEIFIVPVVNPDGYLASHAGERLQRKNMNPRCNVDLNRNWGEWWGVGVPRGSCDAQTFPGEGAFSEPETQAVRRLAESRPNLRFYMDYHSSARQVMFPMCFERATPASEAEDRAWSELYSRTLRGVNGQDIPSRSCNGIGGGQGGCSLDWFRKRLPNALEIELRSGGAPGGFGLSDALVVPFVEENWAGFLAVLVEVAKKHAPGAGPTPDAGAVASDAGGRADSRAAPERAPDLGAESPRPGAADAAMGPVDAGGGRPEAGSDAAASPPPSPSAPEVGSGAAADAGAAPGAPAGACSCTIGAVTPPAGGLAPGFLLAVLAMARWRRRLVVSVSRRR